MTLKRPVKQAIHNDALFPAVRVSSSVALMVASMLTVMSAAAESHDHHEEHEHHESHDHYKHPDHQEKYDI